MHRNLQAFVKTTHTHNQLEQIVFSQLLDAYIITYNTTLCRGYIEKMVTFY